MSVISISSVSTEGEESDKKKKKKMKKSKVPSEQRQDGGGLGGGGWTQPHVDIRPGGISIPNIVNHHIHVWWWRVAK